MAADVHVNGLFSWCIHSAVPAAVGWRFLLPFVSILAVCFWYWFPKLLVGLLTRVSRIYVKKIGSGSEEFAGNSAGKHPAGIDVLCLSYARHGCPCEWRGRRLHDSISSQHFVTVMAAHASGLSAAVVVLVINNLGQLGHPHRGHVPSWTRSNGYLML
jgi:hypothetical protein